MSDFTDAIASLPASLLAIPNDAFRGLSNVFSGGSQDAPSSQGAPAGLLGSFMPSSAHTGILNDPNRLALLQAAGKMMEAGGTGSPYKGGSWGRGIGAGVQGYASGLEQGQNNMLKQQLTQAQITDQQLKLYQTAMQLKSFGIPESDWPAPLRAAMHGGSGQLVAPQAAIPAVSPGPQGAPNAPGSGAAAGTYAAPAPGAGMARAGIAGQPLPPPNGATDASYYQPGANQPGAYAPPGAKAISPGPLQGVYQAYIQHEGLPPAALFDEGVRKKALDWAQDAEKYGRERSPEALAFEDRKAQVAEDNKFYGTKYGSLTAAGQNGVRMGQMNNLLLSLVNDPSFESGIGHSWGSDLMARFKAVTGSDNQAPTAREMFDALKNSELSSLMQELQAQSKEAGGNNRVFAQQVDVLDKIASNRDMAPSTIRGLLANAQKRADQDARLGQEAIAYKQEHGRLDAGWDRREYDILHEGNGTLRPNEWQAATQPPRTSVPSVGTSYQAPGAPGSIPPQVPGASGSQAGITPQAPGGAPGQPSAPSQRVSVDELHQHYSANGQPSPAWLPRTGPVLSNGQQTMPLPQLKIPTVATPAAAAKLPRGSQFYDPSGNLRIVP